MHFNIYDGFYSEYSHHLVVASILAIFMVVLLLQEYKTYKCGKLCHHHSITIKIIIMAKIM
jgi:uncharacterized membrane protein